MIKSQLAHQLGLLRTAAFNAFADVKNHEAIAPVSEIRETIFDLQVVQVTSADVVAFGGANRCRHFIGNFPARHFFRILDVGKTDHTH
jgi:hypothetical protein